MRDRFARRRPVRAAGSTGVANGFEDGFIETSQSVFEHEVPEYEQIAFEGDRTPRGMK
jgi:hypothetical protein